MSLDVIGKVKLAGQMLDGNSRRTVDATKLLYPRGPELASEDIDAVSAVIFGDKKAAVTSSSLSFTSSTLPLHSRGTPVQLDLLGLTPAERVQTELDG
jgi:hypothetical protein